ncbi:MAG: peptide chain release factor N(5)-glutamine methyltransferase [Flavobacteriales bacterium]|nr:peptide chain release factor N(5)-glutamine methyltransferase [Flavobacteriales bacterium]
MFVNSNIVNQIVAYYQEKLCSLYPSNEVKNITEIMFEHFMGWDKITLRLNNKSSLSESELLLFHKALKRLLKNEPVQHITGEMEFYSLPFKVNKNVLIPRPETEELVDLVIKECKGYETILDIGTGSGCIPISLKKHLKNTLVYGVDISENALVVARDNAELNSTEVTFVKEDVLQMSSLENSIKKGFDVIVSNPPYITNSEKALMNENVLTFEPHVALFVEDDEPLLFYYKIGHLAYGNLSSGGKLYFEINEHYGNQTMTLLKSIGFSNIRMLKDLQNKDRIVAAMR